MKLRWVGIKAELGSGEGRLEWERCCPEEGRRHQPEAFVAQRYALEGKPERGGSETFHQIATDQQDG